MFTYVLPIYKNFSLLPGFIIIGDLKQLFDRTHDGCKCHFSTHTPRGVVIGFSRPFEPREVPHVLYIGEWLRLNIKVYISITTNELIDRKWYNGNQPIM